MRVQVKEETKCHPKAKKSSATPPSRPGLGNKTYQKQSEKKQFTINKNKLAAR